MGGMSYNYWWGEKTLAWLPERADVSTGDMLV